MYIGAISVDIDAPGSFLGFLKGLEIAISLCDSGARNCDFPCVTVKQRDFIVFRDFDDVVVISRAGYG